MLKNMIMMEELWKNITGYNGKYQISNYGRVKKSKRNRIGRNSHQILPERILKGGIVGRNVKYRSISLTINKKHKLYFIHRLVLIHFNRMPKEDEECNHIDKNPLNNHVDNLEWVTSKQNSLHSRGNMSKAKQGEKHYGSKLSDEDALQVKKLRKQRVSHKEIAKKFNITIQDSINIATRYYSHLNHLI